MTGVLVCFIAGHIVRKNMVVVPIVFRRRSVQNSLLDPLAKVKIKICTEEDGHKVQIGIAAKVFLVDWGDGVADHSVTHVYEQKGCYRIRIIGAEITLLDISKCGVTRLHLARCYYLEHLNCGYNRLQDLNVIGCCNLITLDCQGNELTRLQVGQQDQLLFLECSNNQLTSLKLNSLFRLQYLYCACNKFHMLDLQANSQLWCVDIGKNCLNRQELKILFEKLPLRKEGAQIMCDENPGYTAQCDFEILQQKGWQIV